MIIYNNCPVCNNSDIKLSFSAKDNTVSGEKFEVWGCNNCNVLFTQNIPDETEIGEYYASVDYISHSDSREGIINQLYHKVRSITLSEKKSLVQKETGLAAGKILDVGCGTGAFLNKMRSGGWQITGIEPDKMARIKANELYNIHPEEPESFFELPAGSFDAVTLWHVLEHVHRLHEYVEQLKNLITGKGKIFIAVPNYTSGDATTYKESWAAFDVPRHLYHFSPHSMNILMGMHGLQIKKMKPMWFDSFYVSMLSEKYKTGEGNMLSAFINGAASNLKAIMNSQKASSLIYVVSRIS